jgi:site-specific DNA-methyltransferase (adenine-specific)
MQNLINKIVCCNCLELFKTIADNSIDMILTSPPYDNLRNYKENNTTNKDEIENTDNKNNATNSIINNIFTFEIFKDIAKELYRVLKEGSVLVWIVGDSVIDKSESGTSFKQALYFKDNIGFKLHDTMIYEKNGVILPESNRYYQRFEYMFVFVKPYDNNKDNSNNSSNNNSNSNNSNSNNSNNNKTTKHKLPNTFNPIIDRKNKHVGEPLRSSHRNKDGMLVKINKKLHIREYGRRCNIWRYEVGKNCSSVDSIAFKHPAIFPEKLARDHILSWSNENDIILDPFMGSGTTAKMCAMYNRRYIGCDLSEEYCEIARKRVKKAETEPRLFNC